MFVDAFNMQPSYGLALERRITLRLVAYWERIRKGKVMPLEAEINPDDIADLWDDCFLVHTKDLVQPDYNYTYLGVNVGAMYAEGMKSNDMEGLDHFNAAQLSRSFQKVIDTKKPVIEEGELTNALGRQVLYRQCLLPIGSDEQVEAILGGIRYRIL
jgi:hypothetical protein